MDCVTICCALLTEGIVYAIDSLATGNIYYPQSVGVRGETLRMVLSDGYVG